MYATGQRDNDNRCSALRHDTSLSYSLLTTTSGLDCRLPAKQARAGIVSVCSPAQGEPQRPLYRSILAQCTGFRWRRCNLSVTDKGRKLNVTCTCSLPGSVNSLIRIAFVFKQRCRQLLKLPPQTGQLHIYPVVSRYLLIAKATRGALCSSSANRAMLQ